MARICTLCGRGSTRSATRSHSNIKTKKWTGINLQTTQLMNTAVRVCTKCLKTTKKVPA